MMMIASRRSLGSHLLSFSWSSRVSGVHSLTARHVSLLERERFRVESRRESRLRGARHLLSITLSIDSTTRQLKQELLQRIC